MSLIAGPLPLADEAATDSLAARLSARLGPGDVLLLEGPIGAGKSAFARALIRARLNAPEAEVPSPTYTLVQSYAAGDLEIWHCDLYRLTGPDEALELGLDEAMESCLCLIEWPDRLGALAPDKALRLSFAAGAEAHSVTLAGPPAWIDRIGSLLD